MSGPASTLRAASAPVASGTARRAPLARPLSDGAVVAAGGAATGALPADPHARLLALTESMYMPHGEQAWLHCTAELMTMLVQRAPSYDSNMFVNALDDDRRCAVHFFCLLLYSSDCSPIRLFAHLFVSEYERLDVGAGGEWGRSRGGGGGYGYGGSSHFAPMFSQVLATESKVLIAATQQYAWSQTQTQRDTGADGGVGAGVAFTLAEGEFMFTVTFYANLAHSLTRSP